MRFWKPRSGPSIWTVERRLMIVLCLIVLEGGFSLCNWNDSLTVLRDQRNAQQVHLNYRIAEQELKAKQALGEPTDSEAKAMRQFEDQSRTLLETDRKIERTKLVWDVLSLVDMAIILVMGLKSTWMSRNEALLRKRAEAKLLAAHSSLEWRIEVRTAELQAEVEERSRAEELNRRHKRVLELLANNAPLEEIFAELTASVALQWRSWGAAIHLADSEKEPLRLIASAKVSERLERYLREIAISFADAPESRAWSSRQPHFIDSMGLEQRPWTEFLAANGIQSVWSLPLLLSDGKVAGTLSIYSLLAGAPEDRDREFLDSAVRLATLVVDVRRMNSELLHKAYEDELTGVANRRAGEILLQDAIARSQCSNEAFAVLLIDLDRFKRLNDLYGHARGDQFLCAVAQRIAKHPRVNGAVARMGGDEFLVVLESCVGEQEAWQAAGELEAIINEPMKLGDDVTTIGASIGITLYPRDGVTPDELERHADAAMYQAKHRNTGMCAYSSTIHEEVEQALSIEEGLREALDGGDEKNLLEVYYQPIYGGQGKLRAFEALLRFRHSELGAISPSRFIPIAEETKLIIPVGRWVLCQVLRQIVAWEVAGYPLVRIGVNVSAIQWGRENFVKELRSLMEESGAPPNCLTLELTESVVMQNAECVGAHMRELKKMGVKVVMDDFGTGYSSLSYLHQLPLDELKIDRSFIARLGQANDSRVIVESIVSMAHVLGMVTVAEGVETEEQRAILVEMGCDGLQGFLFARPMPASEAAGFICNRSAQAQALAKMASPDRRPDWTEAPASLLS